MTTCSLRPVRAALACALFALLAAVVPEPAHAAAPPQLWLPTPAGERWSILQGFQCGSHVGHQRRSLDLVSADGRTAGAPARAAADGTTFVWERSTGTLILAHGQGYYTMYSHLRRVVTTAPGLFVARGSIIGEIGSVGTDIAHLHFNVFHAPDAGAYRRTSLELNFGDGFQFRDTGGCNQHRGAVVVAAPNAPDGAPPTVSFGGAAQPNLWFCDDRRIEFSIADNIAVGGFRQHFNQPPPADAPFFGNGASSGFVQLAWAGEGLHTLYVQARDVSGEQALVSFGPIGYDTQPPRLSPVAEPLTVAAHTPLTLSWPTADDGNGSGIKGYKLYLGRDAQGSSDWFSEQAQVQTGGLEPGEYLLRVQAFDKGCKQSDWQTIKTIVVQ